MVLKPSGLLQTIVWVEELNAWQVTWEAPGNPCDVYGTCGPYSVCDMGKSPFCDCLRGFVPTSTDEWIRGNWTGGCVRRTKLLCEISTSGNATKGSESDNFLQLTEMKLPDHYTYFYVYDAQSCKEWCLNNLRDAIFPGSPTLQSKKKDGRVRVGWENTSLTRLSLSFSYLNVFVELVGIIRSFLSFHCPPPPEQIRTNPPEIR
ncbi:G-type lectin S-receptor-like serine/threonine-protein kinase SD1-29 [Solanum tuberosum]|uniref:G-type lectin S-receptor-like serine/threonine-protein kinase SD1-29 n=1 Tax=Solanum tuberosum TaxID=4113 RepID=UPI00073A3FC0|nr:PREDICTED: G-type lectin S-receptor-like serine/threonine-protein kinase SD1-29 [Solanum tuberosum]